MRGRPDYGCKMPEQQTITDYEIVFAVRSGVTILLPKNGLFDTDENISFSVNPEKPGDLTLRANGSSVVLKDMDPDYLAEALERGSMMLYELENDEVVRCNTCMLHK